MAAGMGGMSRGRARKSGVTCEVTAAHRGLHFMGGRR